MAYVVTAEKQELFSVLLDLLKELNRVCSENDITYYAFGGTMLGAIRHKGFIPWDDDVDIILPRKDYDRLKEVADKGAFGEPYFFQSPSTDKGYPKGFCRLRNSNTTEIPYDDVAMNCNRGIFIDIFPLDILPDDEKERGKQKKQLSTLRLFAVMNTPHAFQYGFLVDMYKEAVETGVINTVEPHTTTLMYAMGKKIYFSKGSQDNIKITTKDDLEMFEGYVLEQQRKSNEKVEGDVVVFLADGFEECEGLLVVDLLRRTGLKVIMASIMGRRDVKSSREILIQADCLAENVEYEHARMIVLPGGRTGTENLGKSDIVKKQCVAFTADKYVAAVCAAPSILASIGILDGRKATVHPDFENHMAGAIVTGESVTVEGNIITGQGLGATIPFALELIKILVNKEEADRIAKAICFG